MGVVLMLVLGACGGIPNSSAPQPVSSFVRNGPSNGVPVPRPDMDPEALVRAFLKATASSTNGHAAARRFLSPAASASWDESGEALILDEINTFVDERSADAVQMRLVGDNVGVLRPDGELLPATGQVETTLALRRIGNRWRIDGSLPDRVMIDKSQFEAGYRPVPVYFADRTRLRLVPDPRWFYGGLDADATNLVKTLINGPARDLSVGVDTALPDGVALSGPVTAASGGGVRIDLAGLGDPSVRDRTLLAAQLIWTLAGADVAGPYVISADGAPLLGDRAAGWQLTDVRTFDPTAAPPSAVGLNIIRGGALWKVLDNNAVPVRGSLGSGRRLRAAAISADGQKVAGVIAGADPGAPSQLVVGPYGADPVAVADGAAITRPSISPDGDTVTAVVDGRPVQIVTDENGARRVTDIDTAGLDAVARGPITELQIAPDGVRAALIVSGQVVFAVLGVNTEGRLTLANARVAAYNIGNRVTSIEWASPMTVMVARDATDAPVVQLSITGTPAAGLLSGNVSPPVSTVVATAGTVYIADQRGVLRLGSSNGQADEYWTEVEPAMIPGTIPVIG
ncbi:MAG: LpqB family beta-propeller domain-containing protein [Gordonia sp. (in: high G+C Gram-positive bacteria)]